MLALLLLLLQLLLRGSVAASEVITAASKA